MAQVDENPLLNPQAHGNEETLVAVGEEPLMAGSNLEWRDLSFSVPSKDQPILKPLSGCAPSGAYSA